MKAAKSILILMVGVVMAGPSKKKAHSNRLKIGGYQSVFFTGITTDMEDFKVTDEVIGYWDPTVDDIRRVDDLLNHQMNTDDFSKKIYQLDSANKRQYWGIYDSSGNKELYVVYIKDPKNEVKKWDKEPFWMQGGIGFIGIHFRMREMVTGSISYGGSDQDRIEKLKSRKTRGKPEI